VYLDGDNKFKHVKSRVSSISQHVSRRECHTTSHQGQAGPATKEGHGITFSNRLGADVEATIRLGGLTDVEEEDVTPSHELERQSDDQMLIPQKSWDRVRFDLQSKINRKIRRITKATTESSKKVDDVTSAYTSLDSLRDENSGTHGEAINACNREKKLDAAYYRTKQGKMTDTGETLELMRAILLAGQDIEDVRVLKMASLLLRHSKGAEGQYDDSSTIVAALSDMGVRLNLTMFNVLMLNAAEMRDPATAWRIYDLIFENGVRPDAYTNVILLSMCRETNDKASYRALYRGIKPEQRQLPPRLATEIMLCRYHFNARENLTHVLSFYELHFDLEPLRVLGIVTPEEERILVTRQRNENNIKMQPSAEALNMIIRIYARRTQTQRSIRRVYSAFQELVIKHHPTISPLVSTTQAYNEFLKAMCRTPGTVMTWREIIGDMKRPLPDLEGNQAAPDLQTWNIILNSCMRCGLYTEARKVWNTIRVEGHKPNAISWNTRLDGFSKKQHIAAVADTLKRMLAAGIEPDEVTAKALDRIKHKQLLCKEIVQGQWGSIDAWTPIRKIVSSDADHAATINSNTQVEAQDAITSASSAPMSLLSMQGEVKMVDSSIDAALLIDLARKAVRDYRIGKRRRRRALTSSSKAFRRLQLVQRQHHFHKYYFHGWRYRLRGAKDLKSSTRKSTVVKPRRLLSSRQLTSVRPWLLLSGSRRRGRYLQNSISPSGAGESQIQKP